MKKLALLFMAVALTGCAGTGGLQRGLQNGRAELAYVHDSAAMTSKNGRSVKIGSFVVADSLPADTTVVKTSSSFLPLIFFNTWNHEFQCRLGYRQIENDYKEFMRQSLIAELKRSGTAAYAEDKADLSLTVYVKDIEMSAPVKKNGRFLCLLYAFGVGTNTSGGPVDVTVKAEVVLKKGEAEVFNREVQGRYRTSILVGANIKIEDYTVAMIEGLSLATKDLNERIVREVNGI